jgi:hypothetical protein
MTSLAVNKENEQKKQVKKRLVGKSVWLTFKEIKTR